MASKTLDVSILVRLVDKVTGPLSVLQRKFAGLAQLSQRIGILGAAVAGISFAAPLASAAAFDQQLRDSVVTAGLFGQAAEQRIAQLAASYQELALKTGIASADIAKAAGLLVSSGMDDKLTAQLLPTIARVAKAASAVPEDVAKVAFSLSTKFRISAADMELALAKLVTAGKLGRFEFRDMAKELPELTSQYEKFGVTGMRAVESIGAALQVAMFGTDSTSAAANNLKNFLSKLLSKETIKNFKDLGIGITKVMEDAAIKGINPIEAAIEKVVKLTGMSQEEMAKAFKKAKDAGMSDGQAAEVVKNQIAKIGGAEKLAAVFGDMQVLDFMLPMLQNLEKYKEFKKEIEGSGIDVIAKDFDTQFAGLSTQIMMFGEVATQVMRRVGLAFAKNLPWLNTALMSALAFVSSIDEQWPGAIDTVLTIVGAFLALVVALAALGPAFSIISAGLGVLALLFTPIGVAIMGIAALAVLVWANWSTVGPMFARMWEGIKTVFSGFVEWVAGIFTLDSKRAADGVRTMFEGLGTIAGGLWDLVKVSWTGFVAWIDGWTAGAFTGAINGIKAAWQGLIDWFKSHVPSFDIQMPDWVKRLYGGQMATLPAVDAPANPAGDGTGWSAPGFAPPAAAGTTKVGGEIVVRAEPGTEAKVQSDNPSVPMVQDRGLVLGRP